MKTLTEVSKCIATWFVLLSGGFALLATVVVVGATILQGLSI